jgi:hypothetical protein
MENTKLVDLEMAKSLKEKGYDKPCEYYFLDKDVPYVEKGLKKTKNGELLNHNAYDEFIYSAPTLIEGAIFLQEIVNDKMWKKIMMNTYYPLTATPYYVFHDPSEAEAILKEGAIISERLRNTGNLIVVSGAGEPYLHHPMPTHLLNAHIHDVLEDRIGDFPKLSENIIRKKLELSNIVVSLQGNIKNK